MYAQMVSKSLIAHDRHDSNIDLPLAQIRHSTIVVAAHIPIITAGTELAHDVFALIARPEFLLGVK